MEAQLRDLAILATLVLLFVLTLNLMSLTRRHTAESGPNAAHRRRSGPRGSGTRG